MHSCSEDGLSGNQPINGQKTTYKRASIATTNSRCEYDISKTRGEGQAKIILSKFIGEAIRDVGFREYLVNELYQPNSRIGSGGANKGYRESTEFIIAEHLNDNIRLANGTTTTFEDYLAEWFRTLETNTSVLDNLCGDFLDIVIDLPWWADQIIEDTGGLAEVSFGSIPEVETIECEGQVGWIMTHEYGTDFVEENNPIRQHLPIYVKTTEEYIMFDEQTQTTTTGQMLDDVIAQYFSFNPDCDVTRGELIQFMRNVDCNNLTLLDGLSLIDFMTENCMPPPPPPEICDNGIDDDNNGLTDCDDPACSGFPGCDPIEICNNGIDDDGDGLVDQADIEDCPCEAACGRDCKKEHNSMEGLRFAGPFMYNHINQQFSEAITHLNYTFVGVSVCDPQTNGAPCPPNSINNSVIDLIRPVDDFFLMQHFEIRSDDDDSTWPVVGVDGVVYIRKRDNFCDNKCWYDYYKAWPKYFDTHVPYMTNFDSHWNGDLVGDKVKFILIEKDNVSVTTTYTTSLSVNVSTNMTQGGTPQGENNGTASNTSYSFSSGISNTTSFSQNNRYLQDIELGEYNLFYCDEIEDIPDPFGQPFTWTGHIPNNYPGVPVYHHFYYD